MTPQTAAHRASLSSTVYQSLLKLMPTESVMPFIHLILCLPLLVLPSIFPSIMVFSSELALPIRWPKYWSFSFSISPSNEYSGLTSFRIDWFDVLVCYCCCNKLPQTWWFKTTHIYYPIVLEAGSLQGSAGLCSLWKLLGSNFSRLPHSLASGLMLRLQSQQWNI